MGVYVFRQASRVSTIELPTGEKVQAIHLVYAYKPFLSFSGEPHNKRMNALALAHASNAAKILQRKGISVSDLRYAVTEHDGTTEGGTVLHYDRAIPQLLYDTWDERVIGVLRDKVIDQKLDLKVFLTPVIQGVIPADSTA